MKGKLYTRVLLRRSVRVGKKVVHHTVANLSHCTPEELAAVKVTLRYKKARAAVRELIGEAFAARQGVSFGAVWLLHEVAQRIGITAALGNRTENRLALQQVLARTLEQGSRLRAVRPRGVRRARA